MSSALDIELPGYSLEVNKVNTRRKDQSILRKIRELCRWRQDSFPGSQPISLTRLNLENLGRTPYVACEKTDGVRYLLFAASDKVFLVDRLETVRCIDMHLPCRYTLDKRHHLTLLDGELVTDTLPPSTSNGVTRKVVRYLIYDGIRINNQSIMELNLLDRLSTVYTDVIQPRLEYVKKYPDKINEEKQENHFFEIYVKDFFEIWDIDTIMKFSRLLPHPSDGIIFTSIFLPYTPGACPGLFKWKPPQLNTVDFFIDLVTESQAYSSKEYSRKPIAARLLVGKKGFKVFTGKWLSLTGEKYKQFFDAYENGDDSVNMCVWECYYDFQATTLIPTIICGQENEETVDFSNVTDERGGWCVERIRTDKSSPNDARVVQRVFESICDGVSLEELQTTFKSYRENGTPPVASFCILPSYATE